MASSLAGCSRPRPSNRARHWGREPSDAPAPGRGSRGPRRAAVQQRPAGERAGKGGTAAARDGRGARACECGALLSLFSETPPPFAKARTRTGRALGKRRAQARGGLAVTTTWVASLVDCGAARARARLVGCRPWATAQAAGPVVSLYPAASSGRPGQGPLGHRAFTFYYCRE